MYKQNTKKLLVFHILSCTVKLKGSIMLEVHIHIHTQQTLLSLSKLSLLASHSDDGTKDERMAELDNALQHIDYQQNIPQEAVEVVKKTLVCVLGLHHIVYLYVLICPHCSWRTWTLT